MRYKSRKFRSLELTARKLLSNFESGTHASYLKDSLIDVDVTRLYQPGDKKLDSRSSLRTCQTMSRVFTPDKGMTVWLVLDISASQFSKLEQSIVSALYLSYLADLVNDKIALVTFADTIYKYIPPNNDQRFIAFTLETLYEGGTLQQGTNLENVLSYLAGLSISNSLIVLISDFCYPITDRCVTLAKQAQNGPNNAAISLIMVNQNEWLTHKQPFSVTFMDAEGNGAASLNLRTTQDEILQKWQSETKVRLRQARSEPLIIPVDRSDYLLALVKYFVRNH